MTRSFPVIFLLLILPFSAFLHSSHAQQETCVVEGRTHITGELLPLFTSRCGSVEDFPCYCNPKLTPPIECPYCGFATFGGELLCARNEEVVSFIDMKGVAQECGCEVPVPFANPIITCKLTTADEPGGENGKCTIELPDGTERQFDEGESLADFIPTRCGSDYPCFCNPAVLPSQIECPYCGFADQEGNLVCARNEESVSFRDSSGTDVTCSCEVPTPNNPLTNCVDDANPSVSPTKTPTMRPTSSPLPRLVPTGNPQPTSSPVLFFTASPTSEPTVEERCTLELDDGTLVEFSNGESYRDFRTSNCGSASEFPCFCNPSAPNQIVCPYCAFVTSTGTLVCGKDDETFEFEESGSITSCRCQVPSDPLEYPTQTCEVFDIANPTELPSPNPTEVPSPSPSQNPPRNPTSNPTLSPIDMMIPTPSPSRQTDSPAITIPPSGKTTPTPTSVPTLRPSQSTVPPTKRQSPLPFDGCELNLIGGILVYILSGNSFGDLVTPGECGPTSDWPVICNPNLSDDKEYPYCIFEPDLSGNVVCARDGETVTFSSLYGYELTCTCTYFSFLVGPQYTCAEPSSPPTSTPIERPTVSIIPPITTREPVEVTPPSSDARPGFRVPTQPERMRPSMTRPPESPQTIRISSASTISHGTINHIFLALAAIFFALNS